LQAEECASSQPVAPYSKRRERHDDDKPRQDEQHACSQAAPGSMEQPTQVGGELLRLGAGQTHAIVESVQELRFTRPLLLLDDRAVQQGDLPGRAAESQAADLEPGAECC
jgi:hypothetical protein